MDCIDNLLHQTLEYRAEIVKKLQRIEIESAMNVQDIKIDLIDKLKTVE